MALCESRIADALWSLEGEHRHKGDSAKPSAAACLEVLMAAGWDPTSQTRPGSSYLHGVQDPATMAVPLRHPKVDAALLRDLITSAEKQLEWRGARERAMNLLAVLRSALGRV